MTEQASRYFELRLQKEIEAIEAQISALHSEKLALQRQLMKARRDLSGLSDVNRKNSITRIMIENRILDDLSHAKKPISSRNLFASAKNVDFQLKDSTFRTHLHRLKAKGTIESAGHRGLWRLPPKSDGTSDKP